MFKQFRDTPEATGKNDSRAETNAGILALEPADERSPEREFDRRWAPATLERARRRMREQFCETGKAELFDRLDRKSTRLNSSHGYISYAVFCLKKKKTKQLPTRS